MNGVQAAQGCRARAWSRSLDHLRSYAAEFGTAAVPVAYVTADGYRLGEWAAQRRKAYRSGGLSAERVAQLESLPGWSWDLSTAKSGGQWSEGIDHLCWLVEQTGFADAPVTYCTPDGFRLGRWMATRRRERRDGILTDERVAVLDALPGWTWHIEPSRRIACPCRC